MKVEKSFDSAKTSQDNKFLVNGEHFDKMISKYLGFPECSTYKKDMDDYLNVCRFNSRPPCLARPHFNGLRNLACSVYFPGVFRTWQ